MEKLQITTGDYKVREADKNNWANVSINDDTVFTVYATHCIDIDNDISRDLEATNISKIAADSLNTYQQCETLPSELLRQNREMKEALEHIGSCLSETVYDKLAILISDCLTSCNKGNK